MDNKPHRMVTGVTREQRVKRWSILKADKNQQLSLMTDMEWEYKNKMAATNTTSNSQSVTPNTNKNADKFAESRSFAAFEKDGLPDIHTADSGVQNGYMIIQSPTLANGFRDPDYQMQVAKFIDQLTQQVDDRIAVYSKMTVQTDIDVNANNNDGDNLLKIITDKIRRQLQWMSMQITTNQFTRNFVDNKQHPLQMSDNTLLPIVIGMYQINTLKSRINANNNRVNDAMATTEQRPATAHEQGYIQSSVSIPESRQNIKEVILPQQQQLHEVPQQMVRVQTISSANEVLRNASKLPAEMTSMMHPLYNIRVHGADAPIATTSNRVQQSTSSRNEPQSNNILQKQAVMMNIPDDSRLKCGDSDDPPDDNSDRDTDSIRWNGSSKVKDGIHDDNAEEIVDDSSGSILEHGVYWRSK